MAFGIFGLLWVLSFDISNEVYQNELWTMINACEQNLVDARRQPKQHQGLAIQTYPWARMLLRQT